jgi:hypothetical protein
MAAEEMKESGDSAVAEEPKIEEDTVPDSIRDVPKVHVTNVFGEIASAFVPPQTGLPSTIMRISKTPLHHTLYTEVQTVSVAYSTPLERYWAMQKRLLARAAEIYKYTMGPEVEENHFNTAVSVLKSGGLQHSALLSATDTLMDNRSLVMERYLRQSQEFPVTRVSQRGVRLLGDAGEYDTMIAVNQIISEFFGEFYSLRNFLRLYETSTRTLSAIAPRTITDYDRVTIPDTVRNDFWDTMLRFPYFSNRVTPVLLRLLQDQIPLATSGEMDVAGKRLGSTNGPVRELQNAMQISTQTFETGKSIPGSLSVTAGLNWIRQIASVFYLSKYAKIRIPFDPTVPTVNQTVFALCSIFFIPKSVLDTRTITNIRNYLALEVLPKIRTQSGARIFNPIATEALPSTTTLKRAAVDYLTELIDANAFTLGDPLGRLLHDWLVDNDAIPESGWGNAGAYIETDAPGDITPLTGRTPWMMTLSSLTPGDDGTPRNVERFIRMCRLLSDGSMYHFQDDRSSRVGIAGVFKVMMHLAPALTEFYQQIRLFTTQIVYTEYVHQELFSERRGEMEYYTVTADPKGLLSWIFYVDPDAAVGWEIPVDWALSSLSFPYGLHVLQWAYVVMREMQRDAPNRKRMTRRQAAEMIFDYASQLLRHWDWYSVLKESIMDNPDALAAFMKSIDDGNVLIGDLEGLTFAAFTDTLHYKLYIEAERDIERERWRTMEADGFIFDPTRLVSSRESNGLYTWYRVGRYDAADVVRTFTYTEARDEWLANRLNAWFERARAESKILVFNFPVPFEYVRLSATDAPVEDRPIQFGSDLTVRPIKVGYTLNEEVETTQYRMNAFDRQPEYFPIFNREIVEPGYLFGARPPVYTEVILDRKSVKIQSPGDVVNTGTMTVISEA